MPFVTPEEVASYVGKEVGVSDWLQVDQERINQFADVTEDHQFIHVDPEAAAKTPFGSTIAHGFLTLSLTVKLASGQLLALEGVKMLINYGFEKVRFVNPVKTGSRIRGRFTLMSAEEKTPGQWMLKYAVKVEIENEAKPALVAEWLTMQIL